MSIQVKQSATQIGDGRWKWAVWLVGEATELDAIDHVVYTLHPTFPSPVRESRARRSGFRLTASGWGEFTIFIEIVGRTGERQRLSHALKLIDEADAPGEESDEEDNEKADESALEDDSEPLAEQPNAAQSGTIKGLLRSAAPHLAGQPGERLPATTAFVSGGVADAEALRRLGAALRELNVRILSSDEIPDGVPAKAWIPRLIAGADIAIFLISGRPSLWLNLEIDAAINAGKSIVPVRVGPQSQLPESLNDYASLYIDDLDQLAELAGRILGAPGERIAPAKN